MLKQMLPYMPLLDEEKKNKLSSFCDLVNNKMDSFTENDIKDMAGFLVRLITGLQEDEFNFQIYNELVQYLSSNFGNISIIYYQHFIKEIKIGSITAGAVFKDNYDNMVLSERTFEEKSCYGHIPTSSNPLGLNFSYSDKRIFSNSGSIVSSDYNNIHIGEYYFNRDKVLKDSEDACLVKITTPYVNQLEADIISYDKEGNIVKKDICVNYLSTVDNKNFVSFKQILNGLESINDCTPYRKGEESFRR